tara:strand:+ start:436 stop:615 length:180 start_codon:yes stop_codon:yes gene_type:complete
MNFGSGVIGENFLKCFLSSGYFALHRNDTHDLLGSGLINTFETGFVPEWVSGVNERAFA